jgi:hypothetical protein
MIVNGGPSLGVKHGQVLTLTTHPSLVSRSRMSSSYIFSLPCRLHGASGTALLYYYRANCWPLSGPRKWVREMAIPRYLSYLLSGGIAGQPSLRVGV